MQFWELEPEWDDDNIEHIARHGVEPEEVEEIVYEDCFPSWIVRARRRAYEKPAGQSSARRVWVVIWLP